jgi:hypothetical protein
MSLHMWGYTSTHRIGGERAAGAGGGGGDGAEAEERRRGAAEHTWYLNLLLIEENIVVVGRCVGEKFDHQSACLSVKSIDRSIDRLISRSVSPVKALIRDGKRGVADEKLTAP